MRRRYVLVKNSGDPFAGPVEDGANSNVGRSSVAFTSNRDPDRLLGIGAPVHVEESESAVGDDEADVLLRDTSRLPAISTTVPHEPPPLISVSEVADFSHPVIANRERIVRIWFYVLLLLNVVVTTILSIPVYTTHNSTVEISHRLNAGYLPRFIRWKNLVHDPSADGVAPLGSPRFAVRTADSSATSIFTTAGAYATPQISLAALTVHLFILGAVYGAGLYGVTSRSLLSLTAFIAIMMSFTVLRAAGGMLSYPFGYHNSAVDPGNAANMWFAMRVFLDIACTIAAHRYRSLLSSFWTVVR